MTPMKRYILLLVLCILSAANVKAQEETKKVYLPEQGEIAIGFDASPVLKYVGNMFNGTSDNSLNNLNGAPISANGIEGFKIEDITPDVSIMAKYMITDNLAVRANVGIQVNSNTINKYVCNDLANILNPLNEEKLIDTRFDSKKGFIANIGAEYRKGNNRIQGIFGAGLLIGSNSVKSEFQYANAMTSLNQTPSSAWGNNGKYRTLKTVNNNNLFIGGAANVGIEYFIIPKVSLGAEVNLSIYSVKESQTYKVTEGYNAEKGCVETRNELSAPGNKTFYLGTNNLGGSLYLSFYF